MSKLSEYGETVRGKDFSNLSQEYKERATKIVDNLMGNEDLRQIVVQNSMRTIKQLAPNIDSPADLDVAFAMIQSCVYSVLDFLVDNGSLKVEDLKKGAKK